MITNELTDKLRALQQATLQAERAEHAAAAAGYAVTDLTDLGIPDRRAKSLVATTPHSPVAVLTGTRPRDPFAPEEEEIVTLVASGSGEGGARELFDSLNAYFRLHKLSLPVPMLASWLSLGEDKAVRRIFPILARAWVPDASQKTGEPLIDQLLTTPEYLTSWGEDPSAVFAVGAPIILDKPIPLGYDAVYGTRSYLIGDLLNAKTLRSAPTWSKLRKPLSLAKVQAAIDTLAQGEVTTYGSIAEALGSPNGAQAVSMIVKRHEVSATDAARVMPASLTATDDRFDSFHGYIRRSDALKKAGIDFTPGPNTVTIPSTALVSAKELEKRLSRR